MTTDDASTLYPTETDPRAVDADIRAELESHLALCEDHLIAEGCSPRHARELARLRFGDFERTARACRRQKLKRPLMLQRLHLATTALLAAAVVWFGYRAQENARVVAALQSSETSSREALPLEPVVVERDDTIVLLDDYNHELQAEMSYVESDGTVLLPVIGRVFLAGMTREEAEELLRDAYAPHFVPLNLHIRVSKPQR